MPSDQQLQASLDRILGSVRAQLESGLRAYADELTRQAAAERGRAVEQATEDIRRQAQDQLAQLRETARKQHDELRRSAEAQIGELRRLLEDLRTNAQQQIDTARRTVETEVAAARAKADADIDEARRTAQARVDEVRRATETRVSQMQHDLEAAQRDVVSLRQQLQESQTRAAQAAARADTRLVDEIRALDEAGSLSDTLERLTQAAGQCCDRAALLMVRGDHLRAWRMLAFDGQWADGQDLTAADAGMAGTAARESRVLAGTADAQVPRFAASSRPHDASAFPITVGGTVVAVLYADVAAPRPDGRAWHRELEILARHAGRVLEAITIQQAAGLRPVRPVAHPSQTASSSSRAAGEGASAARTSEGWS